VRTWALPAVVLLVVVVVATVLWTTSRTPEPHEWTPEELATLESLWIGNLPPLPPDPSNAVADDPRAAELGHRLFFDTRFSANGEISCATCHQPEKLFTDGRPLSEAIGTTKRHAPSIVGLAHSPWFYWDGRKDSQWSQALSPMEDPAEQAGTRTQFAHLTAAHYSDAYEPLFGPLPDLSDGDRFPPFAGPNGNEAEQAAWEAMAPEDRDAINRVYAGMGKAIAAYERLVMPGPSRFDEYVEALVRGDAGKAAATLTADEALGLRIFIGEGSCTDCHNGPLLTNNGFHNIGLPLAPGTAFDSGRIKGVERMLADPFNCRSPYSDAGEADCEELRFVKTEGMELIGGFKVPSLRNVAETAPYMHLGQIPTLRGVLEHYDRAPVPLMGHSDLVPLNLSNQEMNRLEAFLRSLSAPLATPDRWLKPPE
jgi:cytochrome c peroxidase